jgi:hypothetical protein
MHLQFWSEMPKGREHLGDLDLNGMTLKWIPRKGGGVEGWTRATWLQIGSCVSCEHGNEPSGSIKGEFLH